MGNQEQYCDICGVPSDLQNLKHLPIYATGSEGVVACLQCRMVLTEVVRGMQRVASIAHKQGYAQAEAARRKQEA